MNPEEFNPIVNRMKEVVALLPPPLSSLLIQDYGPDPFLLLISCLLSLRARDVKTYVVVKDLWRRASTPTLLLELSSIELESIVYPLGCYKKKAQVLHAVSLALIERHKGRVPDAMEDLLSLPGVGRKTAQLVRAYAFGYPAICVDTHVHRIAHHMGMATGQTPYQTEKELEALALPDQWNEINRIFVTWGQQVCKSGRRICVCKKVLRDGL